jgi:hypothetical protein
MMLEQCFNWRGGFGRVHQPILLATERVVFRVALFSIVVSLATPPSAHTISPSTPTAADSPGKFCWMRPARMICRPRSTASVHFREGFECVTDRTCCGSGCRIGAVTLLYRQARLRFRTLAARYLAGCASWTTLPSTIVMCALMDMS